nr:putative ribonuclease H-like domain-containing protein [Tanacetum cinerariifolium]
TLLLALPNEHQLRFIKYKTAQELWVVILKTFGGNEATKKTKKNQLKQQYGNFKVEGSETLEQTFNRQQVIVSHLEFIDVEIEQDDLNQKFLTSLAPEWLMYTIVWRNRAKNSSGNEEVNTANIPTASTQVSPASTNVAAASIDKDDIEEIDIKWNIALLSMRADRYWKKTGKKISIQCTDVAGFDKSKEAPIEFALMAKSSSNTEIRGLEFKVDSKTNRIECITIELEMLKKEKEGLDSKLIGFQSASKDLDTLLGSQRGNQRNWNNLKSQQLGKNFLMKNKACFNCGDFDHLSYDSGKWVEKGKSRPKNNTHKSIAPRTIFHKSDRSPTRTTRPNMNDAQPKRTSFYKPAHSYVRRTFQRTSVVRTQFRVPRVSTVNRKFPTVNRKFPTDYEPYDEGYVSFGQGGCKITGKGSIKTGKLEFENITPMRINRPNMNAAQLKRTSFYKPSHSYVSRPFQRKSAVKTQVRVLRVPTVNRKFPTVNRKFPTGNISYLSDYEPYNRGYVSFGQGGCKITGKGTIKTSKLKFENVYFVKDLKYNLFSVSQICDNKNNVLFTGSECIVLGRDFKLRDDTNVLLRTPRQHNMYSIDLNNIVPHKDLTCLVAKASTDESELWHKRLGHLNFKTMNRLVRHNLVKGLPSKCFDNDHTCVACLKGKQHKASCKTKVVNSVTKPLHTLHMDLFGPTSVSSLNHKWYCLVVTDDFSRFTWTFYLKTKDETSGILRNFITEIENLKDLKPLRFQDLEFPARVYKVEKAMHGLHQAPRAWYGTLSKYLLTNGLQRGTIDQTLFIKKHRGDFLLVQVYMDDIIFG